MELVCVVHVAPASMVLSMMLFAPTTVPCSESEKETPFRLAGFASAIVQKPLAPEK